jgi:hypothetical protein
MYIFSKAAKLMAPRYAFDFEIAYGVDRLCGNSVQVKFMSQRFEHVWRFKLGHQDRTTDSQTSTGDLADVRGTCSLIAKLYKIY